MKKAILASILSLNVCGAVFAEEEAAVTQETVAEVSVETEEASKEVAVNIEVQN